jgi:hypothetical protein
MAAWLGELVSFGEPLQKTGFVAVILRLLNELAAMTGRHSELTEMIEAELADHSPTRRRLIMLRCVTLAARAAILKQLIDAAVAMQRTTGRNFPWDDAASDAGCDG